MPHCLAKAMRLFFCRHKSNNWITLTEFCLLDTNYRAAIDFGLAGFPLFSQFMRQMTDLANMSSQPV